jgi:hypothetical protein
MAAASNLNTTIDDSPEQGGPVHALLRITDAARFLRLSDGRLYAQVPFGARQEIYAFKSVAFRRWLIARFHREHRRIPSEWAIRRVIAALEARAWFEGDPRLVFTRVGYCAGEKSSTCYLDLGDPTGRAVQISPAGWVLVDDPPIHFRRPDGLLPLPVPSREGSTDLLRPYVNLDEPDFRLLIAWMAAALRPCGPYPLLVLLGEQGSAKSTLARLIRMLLDPHAAPLLAQPRKIGELIASTTRGWLLAYDNVSTLPRWMSDALCVLSTAGAFPNHTSSSGDEGSVIHAQRPVVVNAIDELVGRADLADRSIVLELPSIAPEKRRCEDEFWDSFNADYPRIFGGLLDAVAGGLRELPSVRLRLRELPRMADFAAFAEAVGRGLTWPSGTVISDYRDNRRQATAIELEDSPLGRLLMEHACYMNEWAGTASDLLAKLTALAGNRVASEFRWPKSPWSLTRELRRISAQLRVHDISVEFHRANERRLILVSTTGSPDQVPSLEQVPSDETHSSEMPCAQ